MDSKRWFLCRANSDKQVWIRAPFFVITLLRTASRRNHISFRWRSWSRCLKLSDHPINFVLLSFRKESKVIVWFFRNWLGYRLHLSALRNQLICNNWMIRVFFGSNIRSACLLLMLLLLLLRHGKRIFTLIFYNE